MSDKMHFFLTGTDTGVGKTYFACWLVKRWREQKKNAVGLKPISCGSREDAELLRAAAENSLDLDEVNPLFFNLPAAPYLAAQEEKRVINLEKINEDIRARLSKFSHVVIEGVGGWLVPIVREVTVRDWARELGLPLVVVARAGLGTLNHTLLTVESIRAAGLECLGVILNSGAPEIGPSDKLVLETNPKIIEEITGLGVFRFEKGGNVGAKLPLWLNGE